MPKPRDEFAPDSFDVLILQRLSAAVARGIQRSWAGGGA
jgi:hypothetical protein